MPKVRHEEWIVRHTNAAGKLTITKMTTSQILAALKGGTLDLKIKLKRNAKDPFANVAQFSEFEGVVEKRAVKDHAESRSRDVKSIYAKLDKQDRRRKSWRWLRNLTDNVKGLISLAIWLAVVAAALYFGWKFGWPYIQKMIANR